MGLFGPSAAELASERRARVRAEKERDDLLNRYVRHCYITGTSLPIGLDRYVPDRMAYLTQVRDELRIEGLLHERYR